MLNKILKYVIIKIKKMTTSITQSNTQSNSGQAYTGIPGASKQPSGLARKIQTFIREMFRIKKQPSKANLGEVQTNQPLVALIPEQPKEITNAQESIKYAKQLPKSSIMPLVPETNNELKRYSKNLENAVSEKKDLQEIRKLTEALDALTVDACNLCLLFGKKPS